MIRVFVADDHPMMREAIKFALGRMPDIEVVGEAGNSADVLAAVRSRNFDVLVLDLFMPGRCGIELIHHISTEAPKLAILVWTGQEERYFALRAMRAGAHGYLRKDQGSAELVQACRKLASGKHWFSSEVVELMAQALLAPSPESPHASLSPREYAVFSLLIRGCSLSEIGKRLFLSNKTVSTHKTRMMQKLQIHSVAELVQYAMTQNLIEH
jgi:DNA-binding NarL/FixJ family response regulator